VTKVQPLILLVEDELPIRRFLRSALPAAEYHLVEAESGAQAIQLAAQQPPDLVILDLGLPDMDGGEVLHRLREWLRAPIIILSARDQEQQKVKALDAGADDYLTKPFSTPELLARIRVALRNAARSANDSLATVFVQGDLKIDFVARQVFVKETEVHLTPIEYKLLAVLAQNAGKVLTHRWLLKEVWGPQQVEETHYLRVFMAALRRKIESDATHPRHIITLQGVGYRFAAD